MLARRLCRESANLVTANIALANAPITLRLVNVDQRQGQLNALGTAKLHTLHVKNVALLIVTKPAVIMELTLALMAVAVHVNVAHQLPPPALHQVVALLQVAVLLPVAMAAVAEEVHLAVGVIKQLMTLKDVIIQHIVKQQPLAVGMNIQIDKPEVYMKKLQDVL